MWGLNSKCYERTTANLSTTQIPTKSAAGQGSDAKRNYVNGGLKLSTNDWVEEAWQHHKDAIFRYLIIHTDLNSAEDALIDVFTVALKKSGNKPDSAIAWLLGIARNVAAEHRRSNFKLYSVGDFQDLRTEPMRDHVQQTHDSDILERALEKLSPQERDILGLAFVQEVGADECAAILGVSKAAYYTRLSRAKTHLAVLLNEIEGQQ